MKIVVDIGHPAHVHVFRHFLAAMKEKGHELLVTAADKDIALQLLDEYGLEYIKLGSTGKGLMNKVISVATLDYALFKAVRDFKPDLLIGHTSIRCTHVARWLKAKSLILADTEASIKEHMLYAPFADWIVSPQCFERQFGEKHIRYPGYHELAYLHPKRFTPDRSVLAEAGIGEQEKYFVLRFISWDATHDIGHEGLSYEGKSNLIRLLSKHGRVLISSEGKLPMEFERFRFSTKPQYMHDVMAFSQLCVSEGATMCSEAAMMGVPSFLVSSLVHGYMKELDATYGLVKICQDEKSALKAIHTHLSLPQSSDEWRAKRDAMLNGKVDLTDWLVRFVEEKMSVATEPTEEVLQ